MPLPRRLFRTLVTALLAGALAWLPVAAGDALRDGTVALAQGDLVNALAAFERAVREQPDNAEAWLKLGLTRSRAGDAEAAAAAYERVLEIDPRQTRALYNLGNIRFREDDYPGAASYYARALAVDPDYLLALYQYGWIQHHTNQAEAAEESFLRCITVTSRSDSERNTQVDCRFWLGAIRFRTGDFGETADYMQQVLRVHPAHAEARYYLGMAWLRLGRTDEGKEQLAIHRQMLDARRKDQPIEAPDGK